MGANVVFEEDQDLENLCESPEPEHGSQSSCVAMHSVAMHSDFIHAIFSGDANGGSRPWRRSWSRAKLEGEGDD